MMKYDRMDAADASPVVLSEIHRSAKIITTDRRDLKLTLREHFLEQVAAYNAAVFSNGKRNSCSCGDVFEVKLGSDLVYMDPPYIPLADDNCYIKRYHFLEGLACYWEGKELMMSSKVRKIAKPFTPFS